MLTAARGRGVTLIELLIGLTIVGVLLAIGLPSFSAYLQNAKLRHAAEGIRGGVQLARAEAIRRNLPVEFVLTATAVGSGIENTGVASTAGPNWMVRFKEPGATTYTLVEAKPAVESTGQAAGTTSSITVSATQSTITFDPLGGTTSGTDTTISLANPAGGTCAPTGSMACYDVRVSGGGQTHLCRTGVSTGDSRSC